MSSTSISNSGLLHPTDVLAAPNFINVAVLAAGTGQAFDTPSGASIVTFGASIDFYVKYGSTSAAVPTTSMSTGNANGELNPTVRNVRSSTGLSLISASAGNVTMSWFVP